MSNALFPTLPGLTWEIKPTPTWSTIVQTPKRRASIRLANDSYPLWTFNLSYEFLRDSPIPGGRTDGNPFGYTELEQIVGFYNQRQGAFDDFLLDPAMLTGKPEEGYVAGAEIGIGDGVTEGFQLVRNYGGFLDEVQNPLGAVTITINGVVQVAGCAVSPTGLVTFAAAPVAGAVIAADFAWRWRVRFMEDALGVKSFLFNLSELQSLKLEQVKL